MRFDVDAVARRTRMVDLRETASALGMNDFCPTTQTREYDLVIVGDAFGRDRRDGLAIPVRSRRARSGANGVPVHSPAGVDAEQTRPAPSPFLQIAKVPCFTQPGAMGRDDDAVAYGEITDFEGLEQPSKASPIAAAKSYCPSWTALT